MKVISLVTLAACTIGSLSAQLTSPNASGVALSHIHMNGRDIGVQTHFWNLLGGTPLNDEKRRMMQFPGIYISLRRQDPTGGTRGSVLNRFGFYVKNMKQSLATWEAAGIHVEPGNNPKQAFLTSPDDVLIEIVEDATIPVPIIMHDIHFSVPDPLAAQAWYVKNFGAVVGRPGQFDTANFPGAEFVFVKSDEHPVGTKGRSADHIGFEIKNLDLFVKNLETAGIHTESPIRVSPNAPKLHLAYISDPWGTYIELTEGLVPAPGQLVTR